MRLHEKTQAELLLICANMACEVVTFIKRADCPKCKEPGIIVRQPVPLRT